MNNSTRNTLMVIALIILIVAIVLRIIAGNNSLSEKISSELKQHGCAISSEDLYQQSYAKNISIAALMEGIDLNDAVEVSRNSGFPSDIEKEGEVYLLLAQLDDENILSVFIVNEKIELAFIQTLGSDEIKAIEDYDY